MAYETNDPVTAGSGFTGYSSEFTAQVLELHSQGQSIAQITDTLNSDWELPVGQVIWQADQNK